MSVPVLDHKRFTAGTSSEKISFANELVSSLKRFGFVKLKGHTISHSTIKELFSRTQEFFHLPREIQQKVAHEASDNPQRGWSGIGVEQTSGLYVHKTGRPGAQFKDAKQHYDIGPPDDDMYPNQWLPDEVLPGWRRFMEFYWNDCLELSLSVIEAIELGLEIPKGTISSRCHSSASEIRLNHYPEIESAQIVDGSTARIWPHTDFGIITLLLTDDVGGLEIEDSKNPGTFVPVEQGEEGEMVINVADTLERWTNGVLKAGLHRVMLPPGEQNRPTRIIQERWSVPYLFKARRDVSVGPLPQFVSGRPKLYDDITALQFQLRRQHQVYSDAQLAVSVN